jgi:GNAT superfamily N-acetyltransferase
MNGQHDCHAISIVRLGSGAVEKAILRQIDDIFFEASSVKAFASDDLRAEFRERWLGRFLRLYPGHAFLALDREQAVVGYVIGCLDDPAQMPLFEDIGYFPAFADLTCAYPAHLHVNVAAGRRSGGIGGRLVEAFAAHAFASGAPGVHVVTGEGARNVGFYNRSGFRPLRSLSHNGKPVVFLGRRAVPT